MPNQKDYLMIQVCRAFNVAFPARESLRLRSDTTEIDGQLIAHLSVAALPPGALVGLPPALRNPGSTLSG